MNQTDRADDERPVMLESSLIVQRIPDGDCKSFIVSTIRFGSFTGWMLIAFCFSYLRVSRSDFDVNHMGSYFVHSKMNKCENGSTETGEKRKWVHDQERRREKTRVRERERTYELYAQYSRY